MKPRSPRSQRRDILVLGVLCASVVAYGLALVPALACGLWRVGRHSAWEYRVARTCSRAREHFLPVGGLGGDCPFGVLGLSKDASEQDVRASFRQLCKASHPDVPTTGNAATFSRQLWAMNELSTIDGLSRWREAEERKPSMSTIARSEPDRAEAADDDDEDELWQALQWQASRSQTAGRHDRSRAPDLQDNPVRGRKKRRESFAQSGRYWDGVRQRMDGTLDSAPENSARGKASAAEELGHETASRDRKRYKKEKPWQHARGASRPRHEQWFDDGTDAGPRPWSAK